MSNDINIISLKRPTIQNISLANTKWTAVILSSNNVKAIMLQCRTSVDILVAYDSLGATYWTMKKGTVMSLDCSMFASTNSLTFWIRTASPTVIVEVIEAS